MDNMKRFVSFLLCFVMLLGFLPVNAFAAETIEPGALLDAAVIFSDLHTNSSTYKEETVSAIFGRLKIAGLPISSVTSAGDAFSVNRDNSGAPSNKFSGKTSAINKAIRDALDAPNMPINYVWSDHDRYALQEDDKTLLDKTSRLVYGAGADGIYGNSDDAEYYVYALSMGDLCSYDRYSAGFNYTTTNNAVRKNAGFTPTVPEAIQKFEAAVAGLDASKPLLIVSHQPLFDRRNDNAWAKDWFNSINAIAETRDVAFFYGHNHKHDVANSSTNDYYYGVGDKMPVATSSGWNWKWQTGSDSGSGVDLGSDSSVALNFTHMCAGYMDPSTTYSTSSTTREGTVMAVSVYENAIRYTVYDKDGIYDGNQYMELDVTVERKNKVTTPSESDPTDPTTPSESDPTEATDPTESTETTDPSVPETTEPGNTVPADQTLNGYFEVGGDPVDDVHTSSSDWFTITEYTPATNGVTYNKYVLDTDGVNYSEKYLIVNTKANGDGSALTYNNYNNNFAGKTVSVSDQQIWVKASDDPNLIWIFNSAGTVTNKVDNMTRYIWINPTEGHVGAGVRTNTDGNTTLSVRHEGDGKYSVYRSNGRYETYVGYINNAWSRDHYPQNVSLYLYRFVGAEVVGGTNQQPGLYVKLDADSLSVTVPNGTSKEAALAAIKAQIDVVHKDYPTDTTFVAYDDDYEELTWVLDPEYHGKMGGDYAVKIYYGDELLGTAEVVVEDLDLYYGAVGPDAITVDVGTSEGAALAAVKKAVTIYAASNDRGENAYEISDSEVSWNWVNNEFDSTESGTYTVQITYGDKVLGNVAVNIDMHYKPGESESNSVIEGYITYTMFAEDLEHWVTERDNSAQLTYALMGNGSQVTNLPAGGAYHFEVVYDEHNTINKIENGIVEFNGISGTAMVRVSYQWTDANGVEREVYKYVNVTAIAPNNYPEYPNEGAVKVNKTGTGIDFQSSGIAQVEISANGVPMRQDLDIIVMLDMSSSMDRCVKCGKYAKKYSTKDYGCSCQNSTADKANITTRVDELKEALVYFENTLDATGNAENIRVAIADFNGFLSTGPSARANDDMMKDLDNKLDSSSHGAVYTGDKKENSAGAFIKASDLDVQSQVFDATEFYGETGTNYDHAFDVIYQLGHAIRVENEKNGETDRKLVVIFMSDGAPNQFNYFHASGDSTNWNTWLQGEMTDTQLSAGTGGYLKSATNKHYYDSEDRDGDGVVNEHRMANAIKGSQDKTYPVVRKSIEGLTDILTSTSRNNIYDLPGLDATMYAIGFHLTNDINVTVESVTHVLNQIASTSEMFIEAEDADSLSKAFTAITTDILYAAENARFVDQMGKGYDLLMKKASYTLKEGGTKTVTPKIEVLEYEIYTSADTIPNGKNIGDRKIDPATGEPIYKVIEIVTFSEDGTKAYSSLIGGGKTNILGDGTNGYAKGVIYAKNFLYNTAPTNVVVEGVEIPTTVKANDLTADNVNVLTGETFYWSMGTVKTTELALRYHVYLTGSMEGTRAAGSYPTNTYANLYYDNYLGNPCHKDTVSPVLPWKEANVSYAFYLVDENGNIVVNQTTGQVGSFANKIAVTNPVVADSISLNSGGRIDSVVASAILPEGYELYDVTYDADGNVDRGATYTVTVNSNGSGSWDITGPKNDTTDSGTTYVTGFNPNNSADYTNQDSNGNNYDYTHTVVWFAVVWKIQPLPDTVVVDYGLPVDISVLANDMFGEHGELAGVGALDTTGVKMDGHTDTNVLGGSYEGTYGTATAMTATGKVRYSLNTMHMDSYERFLYSVEYKGNEQAGFYYETVTVIPATTIYYEDNFLTYNDLVWEPKDGGNSWEGDWAVRESQNRWTLGEQPANKLQAEDRPGQYSMTDANNIYGYDGVNNGVSMHSLSNAAKATVDYDNGAQASFTFAGTGFDIISMTSSNTGMILVEVLKTDRDGNVIYTTDDQGNQVPAYRKAGSVDSYYGYARAECHLLYEYVVEEGKAGEWVLVDTMHKTGTACDCVVAEKLPETGTAGDQVVIVGNGWVPSADDDAVWQVPVLEIADLPYDTYTATIRVIYEPAFDHVEGSVNGTYDFYIDAIRIYDPANNGAGEDSTILDAYKADGEAWPSYIELRNGLISADSFADVAEDAMEAELNGLVFIDGDTEVGDAELADYTSYGPNNEVYLAPGQRVAFLLKTPGYIDNVHIGIGLATDDGTANPGDVAHYTITNVAKENIMDGGNVKVAKGTYYNAKTFTLDTATDMYYDLTDWKDDIIIISNTGNRYGTGGVISITNIKSTYTQNPAEVTEFDNGQQSGGAAAYSLRAVAEEPAVDTRLTYVYVTPAAVDVVLDSLNGVYDEQLPEEPTVPEEPTEPVPPTPEKPEPPVKPEPEKPEPPVKPEPPTPGKPEPEKPGKPGETTRVEIKFNKDKIKVGQKVKVTVNTSADVDYLTVNGKVVNSYKTEKNGSRVWTLELVGQKAGPMNVEVVCYNAEDVALKTVTKHVNVQKK